MSFDKHLNKNLSPEQQAISGRVSREMAASWAKQLKHTKLMIKIAILTENGSIIITEIEPDEHNEDMGPRVDEWCDQHDIMYDNIQWSEFNGEIKYL